MRDITKSVTGITKCDNYCKVKRNKIHLSPHNNEVLRITHLGLADESARNFRLDYRNCSCLFNHRP